MRKLYNYLCLSLLAMGLLLTSVSAYSQVRYPADVTESNCLSKLIPGKVNTLFQQPVNLNLFFPPYGYALYFRGFSSNLFFIKVAKGGNVTMVLDEPDSPKTGALDYILWGPYSDLSNVASNITTRPVDFVSSSTYPYKNENSQQTFNLTPTTGQYYILMVDNGDDKARSFQMTYTSSNGAVIDDNPIGNTPTISGQPGSSAICTGGTLSLGVTASNAVSYQWRLNNTSISGATGATYTKANFSAADAGQYDVIAYGSSGCYALSNAVTVSIASGGTPSITSQPAGANTCTGQVATFSVTAIGSNQTYQWRKNGTAISGANSATYSITSVGSGDAGQYNVLVSTACGSVTSNAAALTVQVPISITSQPVTQVLCGGGSASFQVSVSGNITGYQWRRNGTAISGATNATYSIASVGNDHAGQYDVVVSGPCGNVTSSAATLTVQTPVTITTQPSTVEACAGQSATYSVMASGSNLTYQWRRNGTAIPNATTSTLTLATITSGNAGEYDVVISSSCGTVTSNPASLHILPGTSITGQPAAQQVVCLGQAATFQVTATGEVVSYQWRKNGQNIDGATSAAYTIPNVGNDAAGQYDVLVNSPCGLLTSSQASLTIRTPVTITSQPSPRAVCPGGSTAFQVTASGTITGYQWRKNGQDIAGATSASLTLTALTNDASGTYDVVVQAPCGNVTSSAATLTVPTDIQLTASATSVSCYQGTNGQASVTATGGATPYTYRWNTNATTAAISGLITGTYSVQVTDGIGCVKTATTTVNQPAQIVLTTTGAAVKCFGGTDGSAAVTTTGGTGPYTYRWSNGAITATVSGLTAGEYNVTVTDAAGCQQTGSVQIIQPTQLTLTQASTAVSCFGGSNGTARVSATGGTGPYSSRWSTGATTIAVGGLAVGAYQVTVTDAAGCQQTSSVQVTQPATLLTLTTTSTAAKCFGSSDGTAAVTATGGGTSYTYQWNTGATTATINNLKANTYQVVVTDNNGCVNSSIVQVSQPTELVLTPTSTAVRCFGGSDGSATITASGGTAPYTYRWSTDATTPTVSDLKAGNYSVTVTDANGCSKTVGVQVSQPNLLVLTTAATAVKCFGGSDGVATATTTGGTAPYTYHWSTGATTATATDLKAGAYSVTVTDANGCQQSSTIEITQPTLIALVTSNTTVKCFSGSDGSATISATGGVGNYTYRWSTGAATTTASNLTAGTYQVTVTDANGCAKTADVLIRQPATLLTLATSNTATRCFQSTDGSATVTATGGGTAYTYQWSTGATTASLSGLAAGAYQVTVTDNNGCVKTASTEVSQPALLVLTTANTAVKCFGGTDGTAIVSATGGTTPYTYRWNNGAVTATASGLGIGDYSVTVTDANGCVKTAGTTVAQPTLIALVTGNTTVKCFSGSDGSATISATGGVGNYTYRWSTGAATTTASNLTAGTYQVTVTDANGCAKTADVLIRQPATLLTLATSNTATRCFQSTDGSATVTATGGGTAYTYQWSTGATTASLSGLAAGAYQVTVTDNNGCVKTASTEVSQPALLVLTTANTAVKCFGGTDGTSAVTTTGGVGGYTYQWNTGATTAGLTSLTAGSYSVRVSDGNGCTKTADVTVSQPVKLLLTVQKDDVNCFGGNDGKLTSTATGGVGSYRYSWSNGATTPSLSGLVTGTYQLTVTDGNSCVQTASTQIDQPALIVLTTSSTAAKCFQGSDGTATVVATGGKGTYTYNWSSGATTAVAGSLLAGTYSVNVTDANGCTKTTSIDVTQPTGIVLTTSNTAANCFKSSDGSANVTATGGTGPYTYRWSNGVTTATLNGVTAGTYSVDVTDGNSCVKTASVDISQPTELVLTISSTAVKCFGGNTGTATITATGSVGNYVYNWTTGATTSAINSLTAGTYQVTVVDNNKCQQKASVEVRQPTQLQVALQKENVKCFGGSDGNVSLNASGGTGAYQVLVNGSTTAFSGGGQHVLTGLGPATYQLTVVDANACQTTAQTVLIEQPRQPVTVTLADATNPRGFGLTDGSISVAIAGGTPQYQPGWKNSGGSSVGAGQSTNGGATNTLSQLGDDTYTLTVQDANYSLATQKEGCVATLTQRLIQPAKLTLALRATQPVSCFGRRDARILATADGGVPTATAEKYSVRWQQATGGSYTTLGFDGLDIQNIPAGTYRCIITDKNGITQQTDIILTEPTRLMASASGGANNLCYNDQKGTAVVQMQGGTSPYRVDWSNGASGASLNSLKAGRYLAIVSDQNGCSAEVSVRIQEPAALAASMLKKLNPSCDSRCDGSIQMAVKGGTLPYTMSWNNGQSGTSLANLCGGTYALTVRDANGCQVAPPAVELVTPAPKKLAVSADRTICDGQTLQLDATQPGTNTYAWTLPTGSTSSNPRQTIQQAGQYTVTVTDSVGCSASNSFAIRVTTMNAQLTFIIASQGVAGDTLVAVNVSDGNTQFEWLLLAPARVLSKTNSTLTFVCPQAGDYQVGLRGSNGSCEAEVYKTITIKPASGRRGVVTESTAVVVYPNPTAGQFRVQVEFGLVTTASLAVIDIRSGQPVYSTQLTGQSSYDQAIDLPELPAGTYIVQVTAGTQQFTKRIIVTR